ncbi:MAG: preprotein translocase subunit SecE [Desulfobacterales bacterium]|jgi:preprotein translocase subunit SecE
MGRLQRKKASGAKKKKKQKAGASASADVRTSKDARLKKAAVAQTRNKDTQTAKTVPAKKQSQVSRAVPAKAKTNFIKSTVQFLREVKIELKKVTWPSRKQTIGSTVVVIALIILISLFLGSVDIGLSSLIRVVLQ